MQIAKYIFSESYVQNLSDFDDHHDWNTAAKYLFLFLVDTVWHVAGRRRFQRTTRSTRREAKVTLTGGWVVVVVVVRGRK